MLGHEDLVFPERKVEESSDLWLAGYLDVFELEHG